jgi:hypothetical protein
MNELDKENKTKTVFLPSISFCFYQATFESNRHALTLPRGATNQSTRLKSAVRPPQLRFGRVTRSSSDLISGRDFKFETPSLRNAVRRASRSRSLHLFIYPLFRESESEGVECGSLFPAPLCRRELPPAPLPFHDTPSLSFVLSCSHPRTSCRRPDLSARTNTGNAEIQVSAQVPFPLAVCYWFSSIL